MGGGSTDEFVFYLSSTLEDLKDERAAAVEILRRHGRVLDSYRAGPQPTVVNCLADVRQSHTYVLILGQRYGWVPDGASKPDAKSITEMEYDACAEGVPPIPRLVFVRTTNPDRFSDSETRPETADRIRRFRRRAQDEQQAFQFDNLADFKLALSEAATAAHSAWKNANRAALDRRATLCLAPWANGQTVRSLPGHPTVDDGGVSAFTGGVQVTLVFSHDHASAHSITLTTLRCEWTYQPFDNAGEVRYGIDGAALPPQGFVTPERFTVVLTGSTLKSGSWIAGPNHGVMKFLDGDLLNTDPPRHIQLDSKSDDTISLHGIVRVTLPGRYDVRWLAGFTVAGRAQTLASEPLRLVQGG